MNKFLLFFYSLILTSTAFAIPAKINAPFYKVEKNGQVAYMLGTIHTGLDFSSLPQEIKTLAETSDSLIVETDITSGQFLVAQAFPPGPKDSLKDQLTSDEWDKFSSVVEPILGAQAPLVMDRLHPAIATSIYSSANFPETKEPIDRFLVDMYTMAKKPILFFEDIQIQLNLLEKTQTIDTLKQTLMVTQAQMDQQAQVLLYIYGSGNVQLIEQFLVNPMPQEQLQLMLIDRNLAWQTVFDELFNNPGTEFFAFGAAHLVTDYGMIKLVEDLGYTITKVQF